MQDEDESGNEKFLLDLSDNGSETMLKKLFCAQNDEMVK